MSLRRCLLVVLVVAATLGGPQTASAAPPALWAWPLAGEPAVTRPFDPPPSPYAAGHRGVDLAGTAGQPVLAAGAGVVAFAGLVAGRPVVSVEHDGGLRTTYEPVHPEVAAGQVVARGSPLGVLVTGHAGCPVEACLHWGVRRSGTYLDPLSLLRPPRVRLLPWDRPRRRVQGYRPGVRFRRKRAPEPQTPAQEGDQALLDLRRVIDRFGWAVLHGGGSAPGDPRWSHTVGLTAFGHPEVIVVGLPFEAGEKYLNLVGEAVRGGARFSPGAATTTLTDADSPVVFLQVEDTARLSVVEQFYGSVDALQLVWPDSTGTLPWEEGHRNPPQAQPLLGPRPGE